MRSSCLALLLTLLVGLVSGCGSGSKDGPGSSSGAAATRTVQHEKGKATLPAHPRRIVSTSVVLTGHLLALDAPVVGSGGTKPNVPGADAHGWWRQWSDIAEKRKVESLFHSGKLDQEKILAAKPDVIVVSATGGDSQVDQYQQLSKIAPTIVVDYNSHSWQDVTRRLGDMLGRGQQAQRVLSDFDSYAARAKGRITPPRGSVDLGVYSGAEGGLAVGLPTAPQAQILRQLGIKVADTGVKGEKGRTDFAFATPEQSVQAMKAPEMLLVGNDAADRRALLADRRFTAVPSVRAGKVHELGLPSFKLDYYAAKDLVNHVVKVYGR